MAPRLSAGIERHHSGYNYRNWIAVLRIDGKVVWSSNRVSDRGNALWLARNVRESVLRWVEEA